MRGLKDRVALVTGGGSGLGQGMAKRLAAEGAQVAVIDINLAGAQQTADEIVAAGRRASAFELDIVDYAACQQVVDLVESKYSGVDILINNAGWDLAGPFVDTQPQVWQKIVDINLYGPINMHHVCLPKMMARGRGNIVNIASDAGRVGSSGESVYSACKGGIIAFGKTVAREMARHNIVVNCVCPGPSDTPLFDSFAGGGEAGEKLKQSLARAIPMRRLGTPEDIHGVVAFLASEEAGFITGQTISVSGGLSMHG